MDFAVVKGKSGLRVLVNCCQLAPLKEGRPSCMVGLKFERRSAGFVCQYQEVLAKTQRCVQLASPLPKQPLAPQCRKYIRALTQWFAKLLRPRISVQRLRSPKSSGCHQGRSDPNVQFDFDLGALDLIRDVPYDSGRDSVIAGKRSINILAIFACICWRRLLSNVAYAAS